MVPYRCRAAEAETAEARAEIRFRELRSDRWTLLDGWLGNQFYPNSEQNTITIKLHVDGLHAWGMAVGTRDTDTPF